MAAASYVFTLQQNDDAAQLRTWRHCCCSITQVKDAGVGERHIFVGTCSVSVCDWRVEQRSSSMHRI